MKIFNKLSEINMNAHKLYGSLYQSEAGHYKIGFEDGYKEAIKQLRNINEDLPTYKAIQFLEREDENS